MKPSRVILLLLLVSLLGSFVPTHAQTVADPQVWSCLTNCSATSNAYDGAWRSASSRPAYVAATTGTNTNCSTRWWNQSGAIRWRRLVDVAQNHCVAARRNTSEDVFLSAGSLWPSAPPVNCVVSEWSEFVPASEWSACQAGAQTRSETRTRSVVTQPANGGSSCPALTESRVVSQTCSLSPPCWPHAADVFEGRVRFASLETSHPTYNIKATYFCASPAGPRQQTWATSWSEVFKRAVTENGGGSYSEDEARDQCEQSCEIIPPGPLRDELDAWKAQFTSAIGVIGEP